MEYKICEWDSATGTQIERPATAQEREQLLILADANLPPPNVPQFVTRKAARRALLDAHKLQLVQPAIDRMPEPQRTRTQIEWEDSPTFERNNPVVLQLGMAIGLEDVDLDMLFIKAAALQ